MASLLVHGRRFAYESEGDGFPLVLLPGPGTALAPWRRPLALLGELCRAIVCTSEAPEADGGETPLSPDALAAAELAAFLDALAIARAYLAGRAAGGLTAWRFTQRYPERVEGLILIDMPVPSPPPGSGAAPAALRTPRAGPEVPVICLHTLAAPAAEQPLRLGQAMMDVLMQCERRRHLVRGASFLL